MRRLRLEGGEQQLLRCVRKTQAEACATQDSCSGGTGFKPLFLK
jgi:hypothetical protein